MQSTQKPTLIPLAFAANGTKNAIPEASQIGITDGAASLNDGFPPLTMTPIAAGGKPPSGADMNGILNLLSQSIRWQHAGGQYAWNSTFSADPNVGGYPWGAQLMRADGTGFWINTADNNGTNPDATDGSAADWLPGYNYGVTAITGLTNANVTLTPAQAAKNRITLAGALTGNIQIIFPTWTKQWEVVNNTTGAFSVTATTAAGTGVILAAGQQKITGDGTNITQPIENATTPPQFDASTKLATMAAVQRALGNLSEEFLVGANATLSATNSGQLILGSASGAFTITLPLAADCPSGSQIAFFNSGTGAMTVQRQGTDSLDGTAGATSVVLGNYDSVTFESNGGGTWRAIGDSASLGYSARFGKVFSGNGYQKLPSGLIIQWGSTTTSGGSSTVVFPIAFPSAILFANASPNAGNADANISLGALSNASFPIYSYLNGVAGNMTIYWFAIGF